MKNYSWEIRLGIILVLCSLAMYTAKFLVLGDPENTYYYFFNAIGFLPINVLFVTLIINQLLSSFNSLFISLDFVSHVTYRLLNR